MATKFISKRNNLPGHSIRSIESSHRNRYYGYLYLEEPFEVLPEEGTSGTMIYPGDLIRYYHVWDEGLLGAFPNLPPIGQPLFKILDPAVREKTIRIASGDEEMNSILSCYYPVHGKLNGEAQLIQSDRRM